MVIAAAGLISTTPFLTKALNIESYYALLTGGMTVSSGSQLVGDAALLYYRKKAMERERLPAPDTKPSEAITDSELK